MDNYLLWKHIPFVYLKYLTGFSLISRFIHCQGRNITPCLPMGNSTHGESFTESNHPLELKVLFYAAFVVSLPLTIVGKLYSSTYCGKVVVYLQFLAELSEF